MCGRYTLTISPEEVWTGFDLEGSPADVAEEAGTQAIAQRFNIAPTQKVPIIAARAPRRLRMFRWGLIPHWANDMTVGAKMINARSEKVTTSAFRSAFSRRRCVVLADGFYEWKRQTKGKNIPHYVRAATGGAMSFAGLWESWHKGENVVRSCTILTTEANDAVAPIHNRMPVILSPDDRAIWLDEDAEEEVLLELLRPTSAPVELYQVSNLVNSVKNDDIHNIEPVTAV